MRSDPRCRLFSQTAGSPLEEEAKERANPLHLNSRQKDIRKACQNLNALFLSDEYFFQYKQYGYHQHSY